MSAIILATINAKWIHPSLALRLLKANLGSLKGQCEILEFALRQPLEEKTGPILAARPRILGLSVSIWNHTATLELLKALDNAWQPDGRPAVPRPVVVLGGPEVSWLPEEAEIFRFADYVIRGEGEESFRSLCYGLLNGNRPAGGKAALFINQGETSVDTDTIACAYHLYTDEDLKNKLVYVEASRGCPFGCEFCQGGKTPKVREFPLEPFLEEMGTLIDRGARTIKFLDRTFNLDMDRAKRIIGFYLKRIGAPGTAAGTATGTATGTMAGKPPLCVHFEMVPFRFPPELKELLSRFPPGTLRLELGIQTFNRKTAELIHRAGCEESEILEFLRRETNAILHVDLIAGLPGEDLASFGAGFDRLWRTLSKTGKSGLPGRSPFEIQPGILKCLPGTPLARHNAAYGMKYSAAPPYEVIETGAIPAAEIGRIKNFARFWETIVNRNPFPDLVSRLFPPGEPVFDRFMRFSDRMLEHFGRNWGIDRNDLGAFLEGEK